MRKIIVFLYLSFFWSCGVQSQSFKNISKEISSNQLKNGIRKGGSDLFNVVRLKLDSLHKLDFVDLKEPVFFLESYDVESGAIHGLIWNTKGKVNYSYSQGNFSFNNEAVFTKYMIRLVENWDIESIRKEEKTNSNMIPNPFIYATRVKNNANNLSIDCIMFRDFFLLERDR